jgi:small ligand-binding sensory domain FIST
MPAASVMLGAFAPGSFRVFPVSDLGLGDARAALDPWLETHEPMLCLVHGDPMAEQDPTLLLAELDQICGGFIAGGLTSSRGQHLQIAGQVGSGGIGGVAFSEDIPVATTLSQGCAPLGPVHTVTRCEDQVIMELDGRPAFKVFTEDIKNRACACTGQDFSSQDIEKAMFREDYEAQDETVHNLFRGEVHVAFPVSGSDQSDYLVRNLIGIDPESGWVAVAAPVAPGDAMMFVHRDEDSLAADLETSLQGLKARVTRQYGRFDPKGAIYISCVARAVPGNRGGDAAHVRAVMGDIPIAGFYANGEISNRRLYGYTGVLIVFL